MFGNGDGGGGPSAVMLERLRRTRAAGLHSDRSGEQLPLVKTGFSLSEFFENTRKKTDNGKALPAWYVEPGSQDLLADILGLESFTSNATELYKLPRLEPKGTSGCRNISSVKPSTCRLWLPYRQNTPIPKRCVDCYTPLITFADDQRFDKLWESLCLCMFHDTLPGSSIHLAVEDYDRKFAEIHRTAIDLFDEAVKALGGGQSDVKGVINTLPSHPRREVVSLPDHYPRVATFHDGHTLYGETEKYEPGESEGVTGMSYDCVSHISANHAVYKKGDSIKMSNSTLDVVVTKGRITSLYDRAEK